MKNIVLSFLLIFPLIINAQIPNQGFEEWTNMGTYSVPASWGTLNDVTSPTGVYTCIKGTPGNPGDTYMRLITKEISGMGIVPGIAVCGVLNTTTYKAESGFPFTGRPESFDGNWQYMAYGFDTGYISVILTKWDQILGKRDTIAWKYEALLGMVMSWRSFSLPLNYLSGQYPDTALITVSASGANTAVPADYSYLYLDNLSFTGNVAGVDKHEMINVKVYPDPASDHIYIKGISGKGSVITVYSSNGTKTCEIRTDKDLNVDISNYLPGIYFIEVSGGPVTGKAKFIKR